MAVRNVCLIGFMGAGKTAVGRALAERLGFSFWDTDALVVEAAGRSITEIFADEGEEGFREREYRALLRASAGTRRVIACGGGAVVPVRNVGILRGSGTIVYLRARAETLRARVADGGGRPLLADAGAFDRLLVQRVPVYEGAADLVVDVEDGTPEEIAETIQRMLA